jgi:hypothetical protein
MEDVKTQFPYTQHRSVAGALFTKAGTQTQVGHASADFAPDSHPTFAWGLVAVLSATAGASDIIAFLGLGGLFVAHITGNLVVLADVTGGFSQIGRFGLRFSVGSLRLPLLNFLEPWNHGVAGAINRPVFVDREHDWVGQHQPEVAAGDDLIAVNFVGAVDRVSPQRDVCLSIFEFGVDRAAGIPVLPLRAFAAATGENGKGQHRKQ